MARCFRCRAREDARREFISEQGASDAGLLTYTTGGPAVTTS